MNSVPYLHVKNLSKVHVRGRFPRQVVFQLKADFEIQGAGIVAIVGPNGAGKTTLFELIAGREMPTSGQVICHGQNIHRVKCEQRRQLVNHHQQPHHVRKYKWKFMPEFLLEPACKDTPVIHLYDEPDMTDWYIGLLFNKFHELKSQGHLIVFCVHPSNAIHLDLIRMVCDEYLFVQDGSLTRLRDFAALIRYPEVRNYLGPIIN